MHTPAFFFAGGLNLEPNFQNGGGLTRPGILEGVGGGGVAGKDRLQFLHKNKLKSETFNNKKSL